MNKNIFSTVLSLLFFFGVFAQNEIKVVKIEDLKKVYVRPVDTTYVVNFFATWCGPCMMEMPVLNNFYKTHKNTNIQLIFVSLDMQVPIKNYRLK
jgi:thiol-disulfide isomerase/thioredoxin